MGRWLNVLLAKWVNLPQSYHIDFIISHSFMLGLLPHVVAHRYQNARIKQIYNPLFWSKHNSYERCDQLNALSSVKNVCFGFCLGDLSNPTSSVNPVITDQTSLHSCSLSQGKWLWVGRETFQFDNWSSESSPISENPCIYLNTDGKSLS